MISFYLLSKNHTNGWFPRDRFCIERVLSILRNFSFRLEPFQFPYRRYTYEVVPIYWLALTLDPCPWEMNQYFLLELHHRLFTLQPPPKKIKERFQWNRTTDVEPRAPSFLYKVVGVKIHNGSCPSSRTLLSTISFQTKFYHNIFLIWSQYEIMNNHLFSR